MNIADAVQALEAGFLVVEEVGYCAPERPEVRIIDRAPSGDRYVILTSSGVRAAQEPLEGMFAGEEAAARAWLREAWRYAEERGGATLYWASRPVYEEMEYVAVDQAAAINSPVLNTSLVVRLGTVHARLVINRGPAKQEEV